MRREVGCGGAPAHYGGEGRPFSSIVRRWRYEWTLVQAPIVTVPRDTRARRVGDHVPEGARPRVEDGLLIERQGDHVLPQNLVRRVRSEERRVGKEWRCRWWPHHH